MFNSASDMLSGSAEFIACLQHDGGIKTQSISAVAVR